MILQTMHFFQLLHPVSSSSLTLQFLKPGEYILYPEIPKFRICVHNKRMSFVGIKKTSLHCIWLIQGGEGEIISLEQALITGKTAFNAQWEPEKQGWKPEVWVRALGAKGESAFYNCFLKFEPGEPLEK